jgi:hypothetical protein
MNNRILVPALIAGVAMAILSNLPILLIGNCLLCGWIWGGGILAVWLYRRNNPGEAITSGDGVKLGLLAGLIGGIIGAVLALTLGDAIMKQTLAQMSSMPQFADNPQMAEMLKTMTESGGFGVLGAITNFIVYIVFGLIGGLIGAALLKNRT